MWGVSMLLTGQVCLYLKPDSQWPLVAYHYRKTCRVAGGQYVRSFLPNNLLETELLYSSVFHILDSYPGLGGGVNDAVPLQKILLKHFDGATFEEGRIKTNCAQVSPIIFRLPFIIG